MGLIKNILRTAKDALNADNEGRLDEYVSEKVSGVIRQFDGTAEEKFLAEKDRVLELIREELGGEAFDMEYCLALIDRWENDFALTDEDFFLVKYYRFRAWENTFYTLSEDLRNDSYEDKDALEEEVKDANNQCLETIQEAIDYLTSIDDEETTSFWLCTVLCAKAERLHWAGESLEAVRSAIQALPFACDENEKNRAKDIISGKRQSDSKKIISSLGYGVWGFTPEERLNRILKLNCYPGEDNDKPNWPGEMMETYAEITPLEIEELKTGNDYFSNRPYADRQFIFTVRDLDHIGGCYDVTDNIKYVFPLDELPGDISFPVGHPQPNTLYYAHPLRPMYLPFENAQLLLFYEKVHEMCRLFQCLGATKITARCLKGNSVSQDILTTNDFSAEGEYKILKGSMSYSGKKSMASSRQSRDEMSLYQIFSPKKAPYCPKDLLWAKEDPELRTLIEQRLEGGLLEFTKKVSSYETSHLSQNSIADVKVAFEAMIANVSANYSVSNDTFSQTLETEWEISVEFKPIEEFNDFVSPAEQKAIADARKGKLLVDVTKFFYVDGSIYILDKLQADVKVSDTVIVCNEDTEFDSSVEAICIFFKMLNEGDEGDIVAMKLSGVTATNIKPGTKIYLRKDNATSVENQAPSNAVTTPDRQVNEESLTPEEEKYKEELLFCLENGGSITEDDRRYLERKRKKFGISEARALKIEKQLTPSLTEDEKEYLEIFKELTASGNLSDRTRRLLERERESLNISMERATEIEKYPN